MALKEINLSGLQMKQSPKLPKYSLLLWEKYLCGLCRDAHVQVKTGVQRESTRLGNALLALLGWFLFLGRKELLPSCSQGGSFPLTFDVQGPSLQQ